MNLIKIILKIIDEIKKITQSYDYYKMDLKYILINDFESMKNVEQNKLKIIIEKSYVSSRFILITNNLTKNDTSNTKS